ncbi:hypothetical protein INT47_005910 [Mucor saturninus]|uniref:Uncharacterized protein n=1 Tax=Mucor saturninus TaxID=64648 RepID=A0A8H7V0G9_9FUNG|nr:hypothetical protein INT47_005910 [Mucor saturninus]
MEEGIRLCKQAPYNDDATCNLYRTTNDPIRRLRDYRQSGKHQYPTKKLMTHNLTTGEVTNAQKEEED